ncbi:hypothetical protein DO72_5819 [Burkholderia pseudomallei]|nr:hypothetical protein DO72_5819 [Burkholderia pseudomallei]KGR93330.1 hypothetical protein X948_5556 [Burkholderia pseudomallei MSHR5608]KGR95248.1 hypothetical protein X977_5770 [Burkholderia pseudomallei MSHR7504]
MSEIGITHRNKLLIWAARLGARPRSWRRQGSLLLL